MKTKNVISFMLAVTFSSVILSSCFDSGSGRSSYMVVGYIAGFRDFDFSSVDASKLTHINYAFANIINGEVMFDTTKIDGEVLNSDDLEGLRRLKEKNHDLKILISVGGWGWSGDFSDAALTDSSRRRFSLSAINFIKENKLDGIDIDWEYPNQPGAGNTFRKEDIHNFTLLLKDIRFLLDSLSSDIKGDKYLLSIASGGDSSYVANTELGEVAKYIDFINVMSYDLHNGNTWQTGHHTNLYLSDADSPYGDATDRAVKMHLAAGVPPEKINIGIPFYGRMWKGVDPVQNGLYQIGSTTGQGISYKYVLEALNNNSFERFWDKSASAPWLWNKSDSVFISYDDAESIAAKMKYVKKLRLGGVMFWEYTEDVNGMLLNEIIKEINKKE